MTEAPNAVFLSYASQDSEAARRICEALRAGGVEVWFDQSELRGGDVWDRKIRRQIRECALFVPIVSANTQSRLEGYFRREWRLAVERMYDMAAERTFLVRWPSTTPTTASPVFPRNFAPCSGPACPVGHTARVCRSGRAPLVGRSSCSAACCSAACCSAACCSVHPETRLGRSGRRQTARQGPLAYRPGRAAGDRVFGLCEIQQNHTQPAPRGASSDECAGPSGRRANSEKSIAVLPFLNMSSDKEQDYFSDGLSEELIDLLTQVPDLRVPARTSSFYFRGKTDDIAEIALKLRVAHLLEGSVRKAGGRLRITAELIRADSGYHLWSETYDRDAKDVFKVQDEIAAAVVGALKVRSVGHAGLGAADAKSGRLLAIPAGPADHPEERLEPRPARRRGLSQSPGTGPRLRARLGRPCRSPRPGRAAGIGIAERL